MNLLKIGRRRLELSIRIHRVSPGCQAENAYEERQIRREAIARRDHWEQELVSKLGWLR